MIRISPISVVRKCFNTVEPKLAVALYHMNMKAESFSYDQYNLIRDVVVIDISLDELIELNHEFKRYIRVLKTSGISSTADMVEQYYSCRLRDYRGLGKKFYGLVKDFITNQKQYRESYYSTHPEEE